MATQNAASFSKPLIVAEGGTGLTAIGGTNTLLYTTTANNIAAITTGNNGILVTDGSGVPSISSTLPSAVQANITAVGTIASGTWEGGVIAEAYLENQSGTNTGDEVPATDTVAGIVELATNAETITGTDTNRATTPAGVAAAIAAALTSSLDYMGGYNASTNSPDLDVSPSGVKKGDVYTVTADGTFYTAQVRAGDILIAEADDAATEAEWTIVERNLDAASETVAGYIEIATSGEVATGTDDTRAITPLKLEGWDGSTNITTVGTIGTGTWQGGAIAIAYGGTGATSASGAFDALSPMTTGGDIIYGGASGTGTRLANGASGQYLQSNGGTSAPSWVTPASAGNLPWTEVTGTSQSAAVNNGYICNNASRVTVTLPTTAAVGDVVRIVGKGAGGWRLAQNSSELVYFDDVTTTTGVGGYLESSKQHNCITVICTVANTEWTVIDAVGDITYV